MTCARGCCFTGLQVCARSYMCACHWDEMRPAIEGGADRTYKDPTSRQAIYNVMKGERR